MKYVAGGLRHQLAQYRERAAFAQFGSDLDKATQQTLRRGERMVEILKQGQYAPMAGEDQVLIIYAGTSGGLDDIDIGRVLEFEKLFLQHMRDSHPEVGERLASTDDELSDDEKATIDSAIETVKAQMRT